MDRRKRLLILSFSDLGRDPRVNRQIRLLRNRFSLLCAGTGPPNVDGVSFVPIAKFTPVSKAAAALLLLARRYESAYWSMPRVRGALRQLSAVKLDGVLANDIDVLPLALRIAKGAPVIFDAHEYSPRQFEDRALFRLLLQGYRTYLCRRYMPLATATMTVGDGIADQYQKDLGIRPEVIWSLPAYEALSPPQTRGRREMVRLIHHGAASRSRRLEEMVKLADHLEGRFELYFMLVEGSPGYLGSLRRLARTKPRVEMLPPVAMPEIVRTIHRFDLGVYLLPPANFNSANALPNKFFEFVQARLGIAVGPSPEMARIVRSHDLGVVAEDFSAPALAKVLNPLGDEDILRFRHNADRVAHDYSAESGRERLLRVVEGALA